MKKIVLPVAFSSILVLGFGCSTNPEAVRVKMVDYTNRGLYAEARSVEVKRNPGGIPQTAEESMKAKLVEEVVNPSEIASRIKLLKTKVLEKIKAGDYDGARATIHSFGTVGVPEVDKAVFAMKLAMLNARINPATWKKLSADAEKAVSAALAKDDFKAANAAVDILVPVPGYAIAIDDALQAASLAAIDQSVGKYAAGEVVSAAQRQLYGAISPRPENSHDEELLKAYFAAVAELTDYIYQPNWGEVQKALDKAKEALVDDDVSQEDAEKFADGVLADFMDIFNLTAQDRLPTLTTQELNENIISLRLQLLSRTSKAVSAKLKAAAGDHSKKYSDLLLESVARAARDVDFDTRINSFVDAVSDRVEPSVNRILGDGARVLRLLRTGAKIEKDDATSLLAAATYMGFDEVMQYALILGADVNGSSKKDDLARSPLLLALQYGYKGHAESILAEAKASLAARDALGRGVVHYAVLGANNEILLGLLRAGADMKTADKSGVTPLILAADHGFSTIVRMLLPFSDLEAEDDKGFTALLRAAEDGRVDLVRAFIDSGAKTDRHSKEGDGLIELAAAANAPELLVYLLDEKKFPPTERCVSQLVIAGNVPTLQQMVAHGGVLTDKHLAVAVKLGDFPMVKYLVSRGMDVNADCVKGVTGDDPKIADYLYGQGQRIK